MIKINKCDLLDFEMQDVREYISTELKNNVCVDSRDYMEDRFLDVISAIKNIGEDNVIKKYGSYVEDLDKYFMLDDILYKISYLFNIVKYHNYVTDKTEEAIDDIEFVITTEDSDVQIADVDRITFTIVDTSDNIEKIKKFLIENNVSYNVCQN